MALRRYEYFNPPDDSLGDSGTGKYVEPDGWIIQVFTPAISHILYFIKLKIEPDGIGVTFTATIKVADTDGKPSGVDLASGTFISTGITTTTAQFDLSPRVLVRANKRYAILVTADGVGGDVFPSNSNNLLFYGHEFYYRGRMLSFFTGDPDYEFSGVSYPFKEYDDSSTLFESFTAEGTIAWDFKGSTWRYQSFTPRTSHNIGSVDVFLRRFNGGTGILTAHIRACTSDDIPTGSDLASGSVPDTDVPTGAPGWVSIPLDAAYPLTAGSTYAICLSYDLTGTNIIRWAAKPNVSTYRLTDSPDRQDGASGNSSNAGVYWWKVKSDECLWFEEWGKPKYKGNVCIDQLIYQHAEKIR